MLVAAREVFAECGIHTLIPDIAARAGVGNGTVYRHFPSKGALIDALLEEYWRDIDLLRRQAQETADPWVGFTLLMQEMLQIQDKRLLYQLKKLNTVVSETTLLTCYDVFLKPDVAIR